jgi:hypothetical protein
MRAQPDRIDLFLPLVVEPGLDHVAGEHIAAEQESVIALERVKRLIPAIRVSTSRASPRRAAGHKGRRQLVDVRFCAQDGSTQPSLHVRLLPKQTWHERSSNKVGWDHGITIIDQAPFRRYNNRGTNLVATASGGPRRFAAHNPACHDVRRFWQAASDGAVMTKDESTGQ